MPSLRPPDTALLFRGSPEDPRLGSFVRESGDVALLGIADDRAIEAGGGRPGARLGPTELRRFLFKLAPGARAPSLCDLGDVVPAEGDDVAAVHAMAEERALEVLARGGRVVLLGGGHDGAYASESALGRAVQGSFGAINVDAHLDVRPLRDGTIITSGTPFRRLRERFGARFSLVEFGLQPQHNAQAHLAWARAQGAELHFLDDVRGDVVGAFTRTLAALAARCDALAVSLDLDAVEASTAPGVSAPCPDGFSAAELYGMARAAGREPKVRVLDVMELSPPFDQDGRTARLGAAAIWHFVNA